MIFHARHDQPRQTRPAQPRPRHAVRPQHFYVFVCGRQRLQTAGGRRWKREVGEVAEVLLLAGSAWLPFWQCFNVNSWSYFYVALVARRRRRRRVPRRLYWPRQAAQAALKCLLNKQISFVSTERRSRDCRVAGRRSQVALME